MESQEFDGSTESEVVEKNDIFQDPPRDQWAKYEQKDYYGEVEEEYDVPLTPDELNAIIHAQQATQSEAMLDGIADGGPERNFHLVIPKDKGLQHRHGVITTLNQTLNRAEQVLKEGNFSPHLKARDSVETVRANLQRFRIPSNEKTQNPNSLE